MSTLEQQLDRQLQKGKDENSFIVKNLRRQIEAKKSGKGFAELYVSGSANKPTSEKNSQMS
jgi:hypothetical protein|tara:strand:- start:2014 stop:2196 length:183 start_codon:yes stop_codon:yes gene_type:complete